MGNQAVRQHQNDPRRHRHIPSKARYSAVESIRQKSAEPNDRRIRRHKPQLVQFLRRYPLALLLIAWVVFMLLAGVAIMDMTSLGSAKPPIVTSPALSVQPSEAPIQQVLPIQSASERSPQLQSRRNSLPLLSLMAVALSCAVGCLIVLQVLKPRRPPERSHSSVFSKPAFHRSKASSTKANFRFQQTAQTSSASASAIVPSVVPSNMSQPLDWEEPSIADSLDLRQKRPLSYWL